MSRKAMLSTLGAAGVLLLACGFLPRLPWGGQGPGAATAWVLPTVTPGAATPLPSEAFAPAPGSPPSGPASPTPSSTPSPPPTLASNQGGPVVVPQDLSANQALLPPLSAWQIWIQPGSHVAGNNYVAWIDDPAYGPVLTMVRELGDEDGGGAGIVFTAPLDVRGYQRLYAVIRAQVVHEYGGNIANVNPQWAPEGAVQIRIKYLDASGQSHQWYHGFYLAASGGSPDEEHFTQVAAGDWFIWCSPDLMRLPSPPARITEVKVYGFGWAFQGNVAGFNLFGAPKP